MTKKELTKHYNKVLNKYHKKFSCAPEWCGDGYADVTICLSQPEIVMSELGFKVTKIDQHYIEAEALHENNSKMTFFCDSESNFIWFWVLTNLRTRRQCMSPKYKLNITSGESDLLPPVFEKVFSDFIRPEVNISIIKFGADKRNWEDTY